MLANDTERSFFMKEQQLFNPDYHKVLLEHDNESAMRVEGFISSYKNDPRFNEETQDVGDHIKDNMKKKIKLHKDDAADLVKKQDQSKIQWEQNKKEAADAAKQKMEKNKIRPSFSQFRRENEIHMKEVKSKLAQDYKPVSLKTRTPAFKNMSK